MQKLVVNSVEELKSIKNQRAHSSVIIAGEFAQNLLLSGGINVFTHGAMKRGEVVKLKSECPGHMKDVLEILYDLSRYNDFELLEGPAGHEIKMYPKPTLRREGN